MLVFHALGRFLGSPNLVCPSMTEWFGRRDGLREGNRLQDKSQQIIWLMNFGRMLSEWRGPGKRGCLSTDGSTPPASSAGFLAANLSFEGARVRCLKRRLMKFPRWT